ncbi:MAG: hypothetical protein AB4040_01785 [Synechococcus sp.]
MTTLRNLAIAAVVVAGSVAMVAAPASASPGILNRLAEMDADHSNQVGVANPFAESWTSRSEGVEVAGEPVSIDVREDSGRDISFTQHIRGLRSTSPRSGDYSPY